MAKSLHPIQVVFCCHESDDEPQSRMRVFDAEIIASCQYLRTAGANTEGTARNSSLSAQFPSQ